jgi:hypothetical protein
MKLLHVQRKKVYKKIVLSRNRAISEKDQPVYIEKLGQTANQN